MSCRSNKAWGPPSYEQKIAIFKHVYYEFCELLWHTEYLILMQAYRKEAGNATTECIALHSVVIYKFFEDGRPRPNGALPTRQQDDVWVSDLECDPYSSPAFSEPEKQIIEKRNKEIAHLTYSRADKDIAGDKKAWQWKLDDFLPPILRRMHHTCEVFANGRLANDINLSENELQLWQGLKSRIEASRFYRSNPIA